MVELLADFEVKLDVGFQRFEGFYPVLESSYLQRRQLLAVQKRTDGFFLLFGENVTSHFRSRIPCEQKLINSLYPYNRDSRVPRSPSGASKTRKKGRDHDEDVTGTKNSGQR